VIAARPAGERQPGESVPGLAGKGGVEDQAPAVDECSQVAVHVDEALAATELYIGRLTA
jgi:hypothetical protein